MCFSRKQICVSHGNKFVPPREANICYLRNHKKKSRKKQRFFSFEKLNCASRGNKFVPVREASVCYLCKHKNNCDFLSIMRSQVLAEANLCLYEKYFSRKHKKIVNFHRASRGSTKIIIQFFFPFEKANLCFSWKQKKFAQKNFTNFLSPKPWETRRH